MATRTAETFRYIKDITWTDGGSLKDAASRTGWDVFTFLHDQSTALSQIGATPFHTHLLEDILDFSWDKTWNIKAQLLPKQREVHFSSPVRTRFGNFNITAVCTVPDMIVTPKAVFQELLTLDFDALVRSVKETDWQDYMPFVTRVGVLPAPGQSSRGILSLVMPSHVDVSRKLRDLQSDDGQNGTYVRFSPSLSQIRIGMVTREAVQWETFSFVGRCASGPAELAIWTHVWDESGGMKKRFATTKRIQATPQQSSVYNPW